MARTWSAAVAIGAALVVGIAGCGESKKTGGSPPPPPGPEAKFKYEIVSVDQSGAAPVVTFRVTDPTNGNQPWDIQTAPEFSATGGASLRLHFGWPTTVYTNEGSGNTGGPGQPARIDLLSTSTQLTKNADGSYTVTATGVNPPDTGSFAIEMEGHPMVDGAAVPVTTAVQYFGAGGAPATPHPMAVATEKCDACHQRLSAHGANRNDNVEACAVCHNPNATDLGRSKSVAGADDTPIDFKWMVHVIHSQGFRRNPVTIYGFAPAGQPPSANQFPLADIGPKLSQCSTCHQPGTHTVGHIRDVEQALGADAANYPTTFDANDVASLADNVRPFSAAVAVCTSCHDNVRFDANDAAAGGRLCDSPNPAQPCLHPVGVGTIVTPTTPASTCVSCHANQHAQ